ncbi:MAG: type II toxin-antitoxin system RelE/ParE family toxin [Pseudomonadota bacterium]
MKIVIRPAADKALSKMPKADAAALRAKLAAYAADPAASTAVKALRGRSGEYRLRHGDWRALFTIENGALILRVVRHRREAYR